MEQFLAELKRRNVLRVGAFYAAAGWLLVQIATQVLPVFDIPTWVMRIIVIAVVLGFPLVLVFAWFYELTPQGLKRESEITPDESVARQAGHRLDRWIIVALALAAVFLLATLLVPRKAIETGVVSSPATSKSVAVLPFDNLSADKDNAYFASGMQDMILTRLADIGDLKVISRTSTAKYSSYPDDLKAIAQQLGVATILEGSVQRVGNEVLINVQLIDAQTNAHIWAEAYPRTLDSIFGVEGEVAQKVAEALKAKLTLVESQRLAVAPTRNARAYDLFLQGEYYLNRGVANYSASDCDMAIRAYQQVNEQDPEFALAWARLAYARLLQTRIVGGDTSQQLFASAKAAADRALALAPDLAEAHLAQGFYEDYANNDLRAAMTAFQSALALKPQSSTALLAIGLIHEHRGEWGAAIKVFEQALDLDPRNLIIVGQLARAYSAERRWPDVERVARLGLAIDPESIAMWTLLCEAVLSGTASVGQASAVLDSVPTSLQADAPYILLRVRLAYLDRDYVAARSWMERLPSGKTAIAESTEEYWGAIESAAGNGPAAREHYLRALALIESANKTAPSRSSYEQMKLGPIYARLGRSSDALEQGRLAIEHSPIDQDSIVGADALETMAEIHAELGNADAALPLLERLMAMPAGNSLWIADLKLNPIWDPIRNDPRFQALIAKGDPQL